MPAGTAEATHSEVVYSHYVVITVFMPITSIVSVYCHTCLISGLQCSSLMRGQC